MQSQLDHPSEARQAFRTLQYEGESHLVGASSSVIPDFVSCAIIRLPLSVKAAEPSAGRPSSRSEA